jgi:hypothetical protein
MQYDALAIAHGPPARSFPETFSQLCGLARRHANQFADLLDGETLKPDESPQAACLARV